MFIGQVKCGLRNNNWFRNVEVIGRLEKNSLDGLVMDVVVGKGKNRLQLVLMRQEEKKLKTVQIISFKEFPYKGKGRNDMIAVWEVESKGFYFFKGKRNNMPMAVIT